MHSFPTAPCRVALYLVTAPALVPKLQENTDSFDNIDHSTATPMFTCLMAFHEMLGSSSGANVLYGIQLSNKFSQLFSHLPFQVG